MVFWQRGLLFICLLIDDKKFDMETCVVSTETIAPVPNSTLAACAHSTVAFLHQETRLYFTRIMTT